MEKGNRKRKTLPPLRVLSLFSGCGGMDIGLEGGFLAHRASVGREEWIRRFMPKYKDWVMLDWLPFETVFACDILKEARNAWVRYMGCPDCYNLESVVDLVKRHKEGEKVFPEDIDVVTGGFPCQDFSVAGKRMGFESYMGHDGERRSGDEPSEETRGKLYMWMKEVVDITKPKVFIAENVKGLVSLGDVKSIIQRDFASADGGGYIVLDPQVLHAGNYGVPETRERVIFIGIRRDALTAEAIAALESSQVPDEYNPYPKPTHDFNVGDPTLLPPVTCRQVFSSLKEPEESDDLSQQVYSKAKYLGKGRQGQTEINLDGLGPTIRSERHGNIEFRRLSVEHGGRYIDELSEGKVERRLTPRECALIQTFPIDYDFVFGGENGVSASGAYKVIGNAVPPMLAYNIGRRLSEVWQLYFGR